MRNPKRSISAVNAEANAVGNLLAGGTLTLFDGEQPDTAEDPPISQRALAILEFPVPFGEPAINGVATAHKLTPDTSARATGTARWFRAFGPTGAPVFDGSVGTRSADLVLATTAVVQGSIVELSSFAYVADPG